MPADEAVDRGDVAPLGTRVTYVAQCLFGDDMWRDTSFECESLDLARRWYVPSSMVKHRIVRRTITEDVVPL